MSGVYKKLNAITGKTFRLPTEAEWEYAARGGNKSKGYKYSGSNNIDEVAWYRENSSNMTHIVCTKASNELGIYDMTGNVWEWCDDWYDDYSLTLQKDVIGSSESTNRIWRGGGWYSPAQFCCVSFRGGDAPCAYDNRIGFRLVCL